MRPRDRMKFPLLFSPFRISDCTMPNRIVSTGHDTNLVEGNLPGDSLIAYHRARAKGGAGLIILQVAGVHETARTSGHVLMVNEDACVAPFRRLITEIQSYGSKVFVQLFHPGREATGRLDGVTIPAFAPSACPSERFRTVPSPFQVEVIKEIIEGYGAAARRIAEAGADGIEIVASQGYLPAQFINPHSNLRSDEYGGDFDARLRFPREVVEACRQSVDRSVVVGMRLSLEERDIAGMDEDETLKVFRALAPELDYLSLVAGSSATAAGAVHIVPPMTWENAYLSDGARTVKQMTGKPVMLAGRINQPHEAEAILAEGAADLCGMTRALICDPEMPNKSALGKSEDVRACIGCNQACIGHYQLGLPISCIQHPETGRELKYGDIQSASLSRKVMVVGGGVAGMKAAIVASQRGHEVRLWEREARLGGQALQAQLLPGRAEFGGIITNLEREIALSTVEVRLRSEVTRRDVSAMAPDTVILASGSTPERPSFDDDGSIGVVQAVDVLLGSSKTGNRAVVYDWRSDWLGIGIAEHLAMEGVNVTLLVNGPCPGEQLQSYLRDEGAARLFRLGVDVRPYMRLYGTQAGTAFFVHIAAQEAVEFDNVDTIVLAYANRVNDGLAEAIGDLVEDVIVIGDALNPRTAEEAVYEGLRAGWSV